MTEVKCPTLIIWGEKDRVLPISQAKMINQLIRDSEIRWSGELTTGLTIKTRVFESGGIYMITHLHILQLEEYDPIRFLRWWLKIHLNLIWKTKTLSVDS